MASSLHPNIGRIDREARNIGIELRERGLNTRILEYGSARWEMTNEGSKIRIKSFSHNVHLGTEDADTDEVISLMKRINAVQVGVR